MLSRNQTDQLFALNKDRTSFFCLLPLEVANLVSCVDYDMDPNSKIGIALRHAALGTTNDITEVVKMVKLCPRLLLQAGDVVTRCGVLVKRIKLYEFFLGEGNPDSAKQIESEFANIPDGESERERQCERYRLEIEALANQIKLKQPAYNLKPLIEIIMKSPAEDIQAALKKDMNHKSSLQDALIAFRNEIRPKIIADGMHYKHYTTLQQAFDLLYGEWEALRDHYTSYDMCDLVWRQVIGYLQRSLPAVDQFAFARAFDRERTGDYKYGTGSFPVGASGVMQLAGLGFDNAIFGCSEDCAVWEGLENLLWKSHVAAKLQKCKTYAAAAETAVNLVCNLLK